MTQGQSPSTDPDSLSPARSSLPRISLTGEVQLARLVDLCAERLGLNIQYDASVLTVKVTLRLESPLTDEELWALTNRLLGLNGLTSVELAGGPEDGGRKTLSIVKLAEAGGLSRVTTQQGADGTESLAGFSTIVVRLRHQSAANILDALKGVMSRQGSTMTSLGSDGLILLSDLTPRVQQAIELIGMLDVPGVEAEVERFIPEHYSASQLATSVSTLLNTKEAVDGRAVKGKVLTEPGGEGVLLVAAPLAMEYLRELVREFDRDPGSETRSYLVRYFDIHEVAPLIESVAKPVSGSGVTTANWRMVINDFTGSIRVTATPKQHEEIENLIDELNRAPMEARRPMRSFAIRNRGVTEILNVLEQLIGGGALEGASGPEGDAAAPRASAVREQATGTTNAQGDANNQSTGTTINQSERVNASSGHMNQSPGATLNPPGSSVSLTADEGTNTLIAMGEPRLLSQIERLIEQLDVRQPQVMLEVLILSLTEGETLDLGLELESLGASGDTLINLSSLFGLSSTAGNANRSVTEGRGGTAVILHPGDFAVVVRALETLNGGRSLSIPYILVGNNEQATLDSVIKQPFASTNASDTVATTSFGGTEDAGTQVTLTPHIAEGDHLVLEYQISLSSFVGESSDPSLPPPRQENKLSSVVTIPDSFVIAVGGLESLMDGKAVSQVPWLSHLPIIGELFKNRSKSESRSRFFVFIRPQILRNTNFEGLKYLSDQNLVKANLDSGWPEVEPRIIH